MIETKLTTMRKCMIVAFVILIGTACSTPKHKLTYLNHIQTGITYPKGAVPEEYRIRPNDQLFIQVISDDPLNAAFLNLVNTQSSMALNSPQSIDIITYLVDSQVKIAYPQLGEIVVENLTVSDVRNIIQEKINKYLESASVFVKLVNRNISVLGEVRNPGQKSMVKNQLTIFEALGTAGDITDYGNRKNVKLIRELPNGKQIIELDLTDPNIIISPNYYVLPHDVIYVEMNTKVYGAKNLPYAIPITITSSLASIALLIINIVEKWHSKTQTSSLQ